MVSPCEQAILDHFRRSQDALSRTIADDQILAAVSTSAAIIEKSLNAGGKLLIAGNGGSAADAQHIAAEFVGRYRQERAPIPAIALTTDTSMLTAIGNDYGFTQIFSRQLLALGRRGDVFMAISTSGRSANILAALEAARSIGVATIGFTGAAADVFAQFCDVTVMVSSDDPALIQQVHITAAHAICGYIEQSQSARHL
jgi:D-sedoheptulose 7-phosphate isomerase